LINILKEANQKVPTELLQFGTAVKPKKKPEPKLAGPIDIHAKSSGHMTFDDDDE
jgi:ATP-dependent RNA helicase DBP3